MLTIPFNPMPLGSNSPCRQTSILIVEDVDIPTHQYAIDVVSGMPRSNGGRFESSVSVILAELTMASLRAKGIQKPLDFNP